MSKIVFIVGSLRKGSFNEQLAKKVETLLPDNTEISYLSIDLPWMNQDLETPELPEIKAIREEVKSADAIWIFSPAYNHDIPGVLKNALDWLSRSLDLSGANGRSPEDVFEQLTTLLGWLRTHVVKPFTGVPVNIEAWEDNQLQITDDSIEALQKQIEALFEALKDK